MRLVLRVMGPGHRSGDRTASAGLLLADAARRVRGARASKVVRNFLSHSGPGPGYYSRLRAASRLPALADHIPTARPATLAIGTRVSVFWPLDKANYNGAVVDRDASPKTYTVHYDDGEVERLDLS